jgi:hypothetical protein
MKITWISFIALFIFLAGCNQEKKKERNVDVPATAFIQPPIKNATIPFKEFSVDAEKGDTLFYQTGSIILFPPNSFTDKNGHPIKGNVNVQYREFTDPLDFYLSGIPMNYDSSGKQYNFESSGMCEILAYKDGLPVFVNPLAKPEIILATHNYSPQHNLYYLDSTQNNWVNKGVGIVTDLTRKTSDAAVSNTLAFTEIAEPLKLEKANNKSPVIKIVIDPASFKELLAYDNLQFQLEPNEKNFNPDDAAREWSNVELQKGSSKGLYTIKFSNANRTVSYAARPVLEGKDYDKALKIFDKNNTVYQKNLNNRLNIEKTNKVQYVKDSLANSMILLENKRIDRLNALIEKRNKEIEKQNAVVDKINKQDAEEKLSNKLLSGFVVDGFGVWNFDKPLSFNFIPIASTFTDLNGNPIELTNIAVLYRSLNGIFKFSDNKIKVVKDAENMIIGVNNNRFAYLTYNEYNKLNINSDTKEKVFTMTVVDEKDNNYAFIKTVEKK